ncbi:hypothetical protein DSCA_13730 [Desulfosarcina alkanivorans]|uniref:General secretion pathway protein GspI n=1 Tax=Desulfosarcina alkanivorans TaxID=571177 RepID=A0A5K7YFT4_9BACT|nr:prepilin-type N-terminal cleavage/methylation domain-containing protein [Desulfosarcina alkanivorans]BBO67443.1 hypothetical protein DSCA_13730 [Desulfosarcina alkanivorans]
MAPARHRRRRFGVSGNQRPDRGFTLMEVMVALAVVAIALTAVYRMHSQTLFMDARGRFDTVAAMLARQQLAVVDTSDINDLTSDSGDFGSDHPGYTWRMETEEVLSDLLVEDGPTLKRITITVSFNQGESNFGLTTYRHLYE